ADEAEATAIRARAARSGLSVSELCRQTALRPVRMPERAVVIGVDAMDSAGSELGHAVRGECGLGLRDVLALARRLRNRIMDLRIERTREPLPEGLYSWQAAEKRTGADDLKRNYALGFRCTDVELRRLRAHADACRLPVSVYARMRALGLPPQPAEQPVEDMALVRKELGLLLHAAESAPAFRAAIMRMRDEAYERVWQLREEALGREVMAP
ncbi:MAG: hypothetical protein K6E40_13270, partial [Desulfovibrio sp.]|nr:hypothetical protein [Desulfovibrio sp.]